MSLLDGRQEGGKPLVAEKESAFFLFLCRRLYWEHSNENQIWCVNYGESTPFGSNVGSNYYAK